MIDTNIDDPTLTSSKWMSRKLWLSVGCTLIFTGLLYIGKIDQAVYQNLMWLTLAGYLASNTTQNVMLK